MTDISRHVGSFHAAFAEHVDRATRIGEGADQDAVLLDLLSREATPRRVAIHYASGGGEVGTWPLPAAVGSIPVTTLLGILSPQASTTLAEPFPDTIPDDVTAILEARPLAAILALFDELIPLVRADARAVDSDAFFARWNPLRSSLWQLQRPPTISHFYDQAEWAQNFLQISLRFIVSAAKGEDGPIEPERIVQELALLDPMRELVAGYVALEDDAVTDLPGFERLFRESLEPLSHRVDTWVTALATARLAGIRENRPEGLHTGAYGWLTDIEATDPNPSREGFVMTPSLHHATTAAVLRSGWQAHSDKRAFAVDIQSARVRRALAMIDGVRGGQTVSALLGYQMERALHDAGLDRFIAGLRRAYPLAPLVEPDVPDQHEAKAAIGARNVIDGQALRRDRAGLEGDNEALNAAVGGDLRDDGPAVARMLAELDETFDAAADLLLAESVHQLVGGSPMRAGLAADAAGRGQELPAEFDVLRTPRSGVAVTHHVGFLLPAATPGGWADDRPLARLEPGLEGWLRHRLGPAAAWTFDCGSDATVSADALGWCALDAILAPADRLRAELLARAGETSFTATGEAALAAYTGLAERLRGVAAAATPLTPGHLDPADPTPGTGYDIDELTARLTPWFAEVAAAKAALTQAPDPATVRRLGDLGLAAAVGATGPDAAARLIEDLAEFTPPPAPGPDVEAWVNDVLASAQSVLHPAVRLAPALVRPLPPPPTGGEPDPVLLWLRDIGQVRSRVETLDAALVAAEVLARGGEPMWTVAQPTVDGSDPWLATAPAPEGPRPRCALVFQHDTPDGDRRRGLVVDSWVEIVPRASGAHGPEEMVGVAFDFDRPGARAPQALLVAVPPDPERGWCLEDVHACVEETLLLSRMRSMDLTDVPELRSVLPIPNGMG